MHQTIEPKILYFGTPVVLISTLNEDGTANLAPMSSAWALGWTVMLGLGTTGQTMANLRRSGECVLNFPSDAMWPAVDRLGPLTGRNPPPEHVTAYGGRFERHKFEAAGLTPAPSLRVAPPRVQECPLQMEALVRSIHPLADEDTTAAVEVRVVRVHALPSLVTERNRVHPAAWRPLIYNFRRYFGLGAPLSPSFRERQTTFEVDGDAAPGPTR